MSDVWQGSKYASVIHLVFYFSFWTFQSLLGYAVLHQKGFFKNVSSKCDQIRRFLQICLHLPHKRSMEHFIFCAVPVNNCENYFYLFCEAFFVVKEV